MAVGGRKEFGRRGVAPPPVVTHAPQGLPDAPRGPSPARKRSIAVGLLALGATSLGGYAAYESAHRDCPRDGPQPQDECRRASGGGHGGSGRGWLFGGASAQDASASGHEGGASGLHAFFGGFGRMGFGHGGGS